MNGVPDWVDDGEWFLLPSPIVVYFSDGTERFLENPTWARRLDATLKDGSTE